MSDLAAHPHPRPYRAKPRKRPRCHPDWPCGRITAIREAHGHTRDAMAAVIGVSARTIYRWELGECPADPRAMRDYAAGGM